MLRKCQILNLQHLLCKASISSGYQQYVVTITVQPQIQHLFIIPGSKGWLFFTTLILHPSVFCRTTPLLMPSSTVPVHHHSTDLHLFILPAQKYLFLYWSFYNRLMKTILVLHSVQQVEDSKFSYENIMLTGSNEIKNMRFVFYFIRYW